MSELRRPEPDRTLLRRLAARADSARLRAAGSRRPLARRPDVARLVWGEHGSSAESAGSGVEPRASGLGRRESGLFGGGLVAPIALSALGSAVIVVAALWAWQGWSQRSAEPLDSLLPPLVAAAPAVDGSQSAGAGASAASATRDGAAAGVGGPAGNAGNEGARGALPSDVALDASSEPLGTTGAPAVVVVHVAGAVVTPGVVSVAAGSRVDDAVAAAGGPVPGADLDRVNLAAPVVDGERIHVPRVGEDSPDVVPTLRPDTSDANPSEPERQVVDLNEADADDLEDLPGIGPATAQAIVETRERRGPFLSVDELLEVDGIGPAKLEELRGRVTVGPA